MKSPELKIIFLKEQRNFFKKHLFERESLFPSADSLLNCPQWLGAKPGVTDSIRVSHMVTEAQLPEPSLLCSMSALAGSCSQGPKPGVKPKSSSTEHGPLRTGDSTSGPNFPQPQGLHSDIFLP